MTSFSFVPNLLLSILTLFFLPYVSFILAVPLRKCLWKHSCTSSTSKPYIMVLAFFDSAQCVWRKILSYLFCFFISLFFVSVLSGWRQHPLHEVEDKPLLVFTLSGRICKVVASYAEGCMVDSHQRLHIFILCTRRSRGTAHEGGE